MILRPLGHIADPVGLAVHVGEHFGALLYGTQATPDTHDFYSAIVSLLGHRFQLTQSCTGYGSTGAAQTRLALLGTPVPPLSPIFPYDVGRLFDRRAAYPDDPAESLPALTDVGTMPSLVMRAITERGCPPIARRVDDPATINDPPDLDDLEAGRLLELIGWSRIDATGEERSTQVQLALAGDVPVFCARRVDAAAMAYSGGIIGPPAGKILGGHAEFICGFSKSGGWYRTAGSWGEQYGEDGSTRFNEAALQQFSDLYVMNCRRAA